MAKKTLSFISPDSFKKLSSIAKPPQQSTTQQTPTSNPRRFNEAKHYKSLQVKLTLIKDCVRDVIEGRASGFYLYGRGGTGKSFIVEKTFKDYVLGGYVFKSGGITDQGLLAVLEENDANHANRHVILDDLHELRARSRAHQYLLAVLDRRNGMKRRITYKTGKQPEKVVVFEKGLVMISNIRLGGHEGGVLEAIATRVITHRHNPTDQEMWALIYSLAEDPVAEKIEIAKRIEIADCLWDLCAEEIVSPTLRLFLETALSLYKAWEDGTADTHWKDRLRSVVTEHASGERQHMADNKKLRTAAKEADLQAWKEGKPYQERVKIIMGLGVPESTAYHWAGIFRKMHPVED